MILHWKSLKEECLLAMQLIENTTGFKYNPAYQTFINETNDALSYAHIEGFFDDHGWFLTVYPLAFPNWNGVITDTTGKHLLNYPVQFEGVKSRNHAKSMLAGIAIKMFEEQCKDLFKVPEKATVLTKEHLKEHAVEKPIELIKYLDDLNPDGMGLMSVADFCGIQIGNRIKVLKNKEKLPFIDMIIYA